MNKDIDRQHLRTSNTGIEAKKGKPHIERTEGNTHMKATSLTTP